MSGINDEVGLRNLINQLDVSASGSVTVLYGGNVGNNIGARAIIDGMLANGDDIRVIDTTEAAKFLNIALASPSRNDVLINTLKRVFDTTLAALILVSRAQHRKSPAS